MTISSLPGFRGLLLIASVSLTAVPAPPTWAGDCGCETVCQACPPQYPGCGCEGGTMASCGCETACGCDMSCGCEAACGCAPACGCDTACGCPPGYYLRCHRPFHTTLAYKTLSKVAGGIEKVLGIHRLCCDGGCDSAHHHHHHHPSHCSAGCSDCGAGSLAVPMPPSDGTHWQPAPLHPAQPSHGVPQPYVPTPPPPAPMTQGAPDQWQSAPPWPDATPGPQSPMRMGTPRMSEPPRAPAGDPFRDDARVFSNSRVRHSNHHQTSPLRRP